MGVFSKIIATGSYFPSDVLTNHDLEKLIETSDEWIYSRTGIKERRVAKNETTCELGSKAALNALEKASLNPNDIDCIILASFTPDTVMPSGACIIQKLIGNKKAFAFDISAACTGFIYASAVADSMIKSGFAEKVLVIGSERISVTLDWNDRGTCILFGDGAGAVIYGKSDTPGIRSVHLFADGTYNELLGLPGLGSNYFAKRKDVDIETQLIKMKGNDVFKIAVRAMADATALAVESSGLTYEDIDAFIPHQANVRIIEAAAKRINLSSDKVIITLDKFGNTSAATIPTSLDIAIGEGKIKKGDNVVSAAFGAGLTWGSMVFTL